MPSGILPQMATRSLARRPDDRSTWAQPAPLRRKPRRFRWLRRLLKLVIFLGIVGVLAWIYLLQVYAPGLRTEARQVPALVTHQLLLQNAAYVPGRDINQDMQHAIVAIEDRRFYQHPGIDPLGMARALWINLTRQHVDQGGSTLEQQLIKRTLVPDDRSVHGKLRSIALAWAVDQDFSKAKIIELYLNAAYYGQGAYGIGEAARVYFATDPAHLTLPEAAFVAALPQAPSIFGADPHGAAIRQRQLKVLQDMEELGYITPAEQKKAAATHLVFALPNP
jgi:membrane peptidoglycan carboxypeptidase